MAGSVERFKPLKESAEASHVRGHIERLDRKILEGERLLRSESIALEREALRKAVEAAKLLKAEKQALWGKEMRGPDERLH